MNVKLLELYRNSSAKAQASLGSLFAYRDYLTNAKNKLLRWCGRESTDPTSITEAITVSIASQNDPLTEVLCYVTQADYESALDAEEGATVEVAINSVDKVAVAAESLLSAVESQVSGITAQAEFVDTALSNLGEDASNLADQYVNKVRALVPEVASSTIEQFSGLLRSGSTTDALRGFIESRSLWNFTKRTSESGNEYIVQYSSGDYSTQVSPWQLAFQRIGETISSFFTGVVWQGILRIGDFFNSVINAIVKFAQWLAAKLLAPLTTNFEKARGGMGLLDIPLVQIYVGEINQSTHTIEAYNQSRELTPINNQELDFVWWGTNAVVLHNNTRFSYQQTLAGFWKLIESSIIVYDSDHDDYVYRTMQVVVPSDPFEMVIQIGVTEQHVVVASIHPLIKYSDLSGLKDTEIIKMIASSAVKAVRIWAEDGPMMPNIAAYNFNNYTANLAGFITTPPLGDDDNFLPAQIIKYLPWFDPDFDGTTALATTCEYRGRLVIGMLGYFVRHGCLATYAENGNYEVAINWSYACEYALLGNATTSVSAMLTMCASSWFDPSGPTRVEFDTLETLDVSEYTSFQPYSQYSPIPVTVHYQTINDQTTEFLRYIVIAAIVVAAVFVTVRFAKFRRNRRIKAELAQAAADDYSWKMADGNHDLKTYKKLRKKAIRTTRLNSLLGIGSPAAAATAGLAGIGAVADQLTSLMKRDVTSTTSNPYSLEAIRDLLKPVQE